MNEDTLTYSILQLVATTGEYESEDDLINTVKKIKQELFPYVGTAKDSAHVPF